MRKYLLFILLLAAACKPYKDPDPITDPRLVTPYCNDPAAINFNWDFPGVPDNSVCFYPSDVFEGNYIWRDSVINEDFVVLSYDSTFVTLTKIDTTSLSLTGKCGADIRLSATKFLNIIIDSIDGDGQKFCNATDTIIGSGLKTGFTDSTKFTMSYTIVSDTGKTRHKALFLKQ